MILEIDNIEIEVNTVRPEIYINEVEENGSWKVVGAPIWLPLNIDIPGWEGKKDVKLKLPKESWLLKNAVYHNRSIHYVECEYYPG